MLMSVVVQQSTESADRCAAGQERLVGRSAASAAVGVAKKEVKVELGRPQIVSSTLLMSPMT